MTQNFLMLALDTLARDLLDKASKDYSDRWTPSDGEDGNSDPITEPMCIPITFVSGKKIDELDGLPDGMNSSTAVGLGLSTPMPTTLVKAALSSVANKIIFTGMMRNVVRDGMMDAFVLIHEAWTHNLSAEEAERRKEHPKQVREYEGARTCVVLQLHTKEGTRVYTQTMAQGKPNGEVHFMSNVPGEDEGATLRGSMVTDPAHATH